MADSKVQMLAEDLEVGTESHCPLDMPCQCRAGTMQPFGIQYP